MKKKRKEKKICFKKKKKINMGKNFKLINI